MLADNCLQDNFLFHSVVMSTYYYNSDLIPLNV